MCGHANSVVVMKIIILFLILLLVGYFVFSDKAIFMESIKKRLFDLDLPAVITKDKELQDMSPAASPDYSEQDRKRLDSILLDSQPAHL